MAPTTESMLEAVRRLVDEVVLPSVERWDRDDVLPQEVLDRLGELGVPGRVRPAAYGGRALPVSAMVDVWRTLAQGWISLTGAVNTTALATELLVRYGTEAAARALAAGDRDAARCGRRSRSPSRARAAT